MPRFRNIGAAAHVYKPAGDPDSLFVDAGQIVETPGELAPEQPADAYVVGEGDQARAWPKALWELVEDKPATKPSSSAAPAAVKEN
jgi:hypothetical protein